MRGGGHLQPLRQGNPVRVDSRLTFQPEGTFTRAEAAAIVSRMARTEQRLLLWS